MTRPRAPSRLGTLIADIIRQDGPIGVDRFMALALAHPTLGYYVTRDPLGAAGDFTTAPEISQMFGEMIGLWCAATHAAMGAPSAIHLVELGPGRGTLMADLLRAARLVPAFTQAVTLHLVEVSPMLRDAQARTLAATGLTPHWHDTVDTLPPGPALVVANEFFDALPVRQFVRQADGWHERQVGLSPEGALAFGLAGAPSRALEALAPHGALPPGTPLEISPASLAVMDTLATRIAREGGAVLAIDYGYAGPPLGDTLQAMARHGRTDPLAAPGEADLTAHVDFGALGRAAVRAGAVAHGPVPQGAFLRDLGIAARAATLARHRPDRAAGLEADLARLTGPAPGMGELFRVLAVTPPGAPVPPGFGLPPPPPASLPT